MIIKNDLLMRVRSSDLTIFFVGMIGSAFFTLLYNIYSESKSETSHFNKMGKIKIEKSSYNLNNS